VPGTDFEIGVDTLILAISQHAVLDFFGDRAPDLTPAGYIAVDPVTFETSVPGVYAGGDVAARGPASIVQAAADGKRVAAAIAAALGVPPQHPAAEPSGASTRSEMQALVVRRARREYRVPILTSDLERRDGFEETVLGYSADEAMKEASRCLDCDKICSLCVGVCPNLALMTYEMAPVRAELPVLAVANGTVVANGSAPFVADQRLQIAVLTDFCNECGNCVTACPTSGKPYVDKPRLYLDRADFEAQASNAFMLLGDGTMEARFDGRTHRISVNGRIEYTAPGFRAVLERDTFALVEATPTGAADGEPLSLQPAAVMATLLTGVTGSLPHIPTAAAAGSRVMPPATAQQAGAAE
jgi:putative selenate reductase